MKRYGVIFLLSAALAAPLAIGQPGGDKPSEPKLAAVNERAMYEDIEIMRRVLLRNLGGRSAVFRMAQCTTCHTTNSAYFEFSDADAATGRAFHAYQDITKRSGIAFTDIDGNGVADVFVANGPHPHGGAASFSLEGSYLKGCGVVYNLVLPATARDELAATAVPSVAKSDSDWEQARRQVRGDSTAPPAPAKKPTLVDVLLQVLAENGKNFKQLPADEKLTIVVTFRGDSTNLMSLRFTKLTTPSAGAGSAAPPPPGSDDAGSAGPAAGSSEPLTPDRELELLADLHVKRGNLSDAASAFDRALTQANEAAIRAGDATAMERARSRLRDIARKLAETHLKMNNFDAARKALDAAAGNVPKTAAKSDAKTEPAVMLPGKLIVSVTKRALDLAGTHALPAEEFRKHVAIEAPSVEKK